MRRLILVTVASLFLAGTALAQGVQTGTLRGVVTDQQDRPVPGATVTVTSDALIGPRTTVSDAQGNYALTALPPGTYEMKVELAGFATAARSVVISLGLVVQQDATLRAGGVVERVEVVATAAVPI